MASNNSNLIFLAGDPQGVRYVATWDASTGTFPAGANGGDLYRVSVGGVVDGVSFSVGDSLIASAANASTTTFASNWTRVPNAADVTSVHGRIGSVVAQEADYDLGELGDVTITAPAVNHVLQYNGSVWVNTAIATSSGSYAGEVANAVARLALPSNPGQIAYQIDRKIMYQQIRNPGSSNANWIEIGRITNATTWDSTASTFDSTGFTWDITG